MDFPALNIDDPKTQGILALAMGLMKASGPSPYPVPLGGVIGQGGMGALATYSSAKSDQVKQQQQQTLINLEQLKALREGGQLDFQRSLFGLPPLNLGGPANPTQQQQPPSPMGQAPQPVGMTPQAAPTQVASMGQMPSMTPPTGTAPSTGPLPIPPNSPMAQLSPDVQTAIRFQLGAPGTGAIVQKGFEPVIGREGGIYRKKQDGTMELDPAWLEGERKRLELQKGIEDQHTIVDVPLANGQTRKMTKAQALNLTGATNQIVNAIPGLDKEQVGNIQSQLAAEPDKPIDFNMTIGGRPVKMTLQPIGGSGFVSGQSTEARSAAEKSGTNAGDVQSQIDTEANGALQSRRILSEMRGLSQDFTQGKVAPFKRALGEWAQALNLPGDWSQEIKGAESQQALQKLTAQMATAAMKQFTNRGTQMEFKTFLQNNPNAELTPGGFQKVMEFMDKTSATSIEKQQAYVEWRKTHPVEESQNFLAEWNKKQNADLVGGEGATKFPTPPQAAINRLKMKPAEREQFESIFGPGSADKALGKK
jgi:hypothetical protein